MRISVMTPAVLKHQKLKGVGLYAYTRSPIHTFLWSGSPSGRSGNDIPRSRSLDRRVRSRREGESGRIVLEGPLHGPGPRTAGKEFHHLARRTVCEYRVDDLVGTLLLAIQRSEYVLRRMQSSSNPWL